MQNKYDTNITLEDNSSLTYMLKHIESGTTVLEFGPATGYMTKYLKEELKCHVYIVEIDPDAFEKANVYAQDGICGSAEDRVWRERFQKISFDYIVFADVLEHLVNPYQVLKWAVEVLNESTGKVLVSLPNIGHNAVLIDLINNKFEYRRTGILDNTHLRFFTHDSAVEMFRESGLYIIDEDAVVFNLDYAGFGNSETDVSENVWRDLMLREYGFVNQFLFTLSTKKHEKEIVKKQETLSYECSLYYTKDLEYCEEQKIIGSVQINNGRFYAQFVLDRETESKKMIIELFSFAGIIEDMQIGTNIVIDKIEPINGKMYDDNHCFWWDNIKIQVECNDTQNLKYVNVSGKLGATQISQLGEYIIEIENHHKERVIENDLEIQRLNEAVEEKDRALRHEGEEIQRLNEAVKEKDKRLLEQIEQLKESDIFIQKIKATKWFGIFGKSVMRDK